MGSLFSKPSPFVSDTAKCATEVKGTYPTTQEEAQKLYKSYDYVVVGAGATGCVLAHRLSEDPSVSVLLIEAGDNHEKELNSRIPIGFGKLFKSTCDWEYYTVPQPELAGRSLYWPRGKMLGGSTSISAMLYHHCAPSDFDEWERMGAKGWSYNDIAPYFRKSEKFTPHVLYPNVKSEDRGDSGLWQTGYSYCGELTKAFIKACTTVGIPHNPDVNTPRGTTGVTKTVAFIDAKGQRSSSATAYLMPDITSRPNLTILLKTTATRILFSTDATPGAIGIELASSSSAPRYAVSAKREVLVCCGSLNTPALLNLSGIGAVDELKKFDIKVVKDLPAVGKNLKDHLTSGEISFRAKKGTSINFMYHPLRSIPSILRWFWNGTGPASSNSVGECACFIRSTDTTLPFDSKASANIVPEDTSSSSEAPDLEFVAAGITFINHGFTLPPGYVDMFTIVPCHLRPRSTGTVFLGSVSPFEKPMVDPKYLSDPNDLRTLARGLRLGLRIGRSEPLLSKLDLAHDHPATKEGQFWLSDSDPDKITDDEIEDYIRKKGETLYHPVGTARIGQDPRASVVSSELKVHGVSGLRVIDASIFPEQISGHPTATLIAISERMAEMILKN